MTLNGDVMTFNGNTGCEEVYMDMAGGGDGDFRLGVTGAGYAVLDGDQYLVNSGLADWFYIDAGYPQGKIYSIINLYN